MKYQEIINKIRALSPNEYSDEEYLDWLSTVENDVQKNVIKSNAPIKYPTADAAAMISPPYDDLYVFYVCGSIAYWQKDFESYQQNMGLYQSRMKEYEMWYSRTNGGFTHSFKNWI